MAWLRTGTASIGNGANVVTVSGVNIISARVKKGQQFSFQNDTTGPYEIEEIISGNQFRIVPNYSGTTKTGQPYAITPIYGLARNVEEALDEIFDWLSGLSEGTASNGLTVNYDNQLKFKVDQNGALLNGLLTGTAVTQTVRDTTIGRLLKVGDFGRQGNAINLLATDNLNEILEDGLYYWSSNNTPVNAPFGGACIMVIDKGSPDNVVQTITRMSNTVAQQAWRSSVTGGFLGWQFSVTDKAAALSARLANTTGSSANSLILNTGLEYSTQATFFDGMKIRFRPPVTNTGGVGVNVDGSGAVAARLYGTSTTVIPAGFLDSSLGAIGVEYEAIWRSSPSNWLLRKVP